MNQTKTGAMPNGRRRMLLDTAAKEFAAVGYEQASLNRIIRACGMSKSSFYHYVRSKRELYDLAVHHVAGSLARTIEVPSPREFAGDGFWTRAEQLIDALTALAEREPSSLDLGRMLAQPGAPDTADGALAQILGAIEAWLDETLAIGRAAGAVRDDLPTELQGRLTFAVLRTFDEWTMHRHADLGPGQARALVGSQLDTLKRLLAPTPHPRP